MKKKAPKKERVKVYNEEGLKLLAGRLKALRTKKGFTQEKLAHQSGLTLSQIARIETSRANPTVSTIFKIVRTFKVRV